MDKIVRFNILGRVTTSWTYSNIPLIQWTLRKHFWQERPDGNDNPFSDDEEHDDPEFDAELDDMINTACDRADRAETISGHSQMAGKGCKSISWRKKKLKIPTICF